ncbi:MAG: ABC transporter permease [Acidimicrobiia bacterium]
MPARLRRLSLSVGAVVVLCALWEGYKLIDGNLLGWHAPAHSDDRSMPHVWTMLSRLGDPENRGTSRPVAAAVLEASWYTLRIAGAGFLAGSLIGLGVAVLMQRFVFVERALLPWVVLTQTIPLIVLAPLVVIWGGRLELFGVQWKLWMSVATISAFLSFCPMAVGALRGLQSPSPASVELMRSLAATPRATLLRLRFPSAVPFLIPAMRLAAASSIVGAIVAEISTGTSGGIGRLLLEYSREATSDPAKVYTAMMGAALLGLVVAGLVAAVDTFVMRNRPREVST